MPWDGVSYLIQNELSRSKGVKGLQNDSGGHGADETLPHGLVREVIGQLL